MIIIQHLNSTKENLRKLALQIRIIISNGIKNGVFVPDNEVFFRWKLRDFKYGERGIESSGANGEAFIKKAWFTASSKAIDMIKQDRSYKVAQLELQKIISKKDQVDHGLEQFIRKIVKNTFTPEDIKYTTDPVNRLLDDLFEKPAKYGAEIQLQGIVIKSKVVKPANGIVIRQPKIEDIQKETRSYYGPSSASPFPINPSVFVEIEFFGRTGREIQEKIKKIIIILRLFKIASVNYSSYQMYSDSITDIMAQGILTSGQKEPVLETDIIQSDEEVKLKSFWKIVEKILLTKSYTFESSDSNPISIAYTQYSDALMHNGILEQRIASAVMGLEALLLSETQELSYRLSLRVAKIMHFLGVEPLKIKETIQDGYYVRSLFVHGDTLTKQQMNKIQSKYGEMKNLFLSIMECLRKTLVIVLIAEEEKTSFIKLIDKSLIDNNSVNELKKLINTARKVL